MMRAQFDCSRRRLVSPAFLLILALCLSVAGAGVLWAQEGEPTASTRASRPGTSAPSTAPAAAPLQLHAYTLEHQPAVEVLPLVYPLLSERGTIELKPQENTLVVRDVRQHIHRILPVLYGFDRPSQAIDLEIQLVRATSRAFSPIPENQVPAPLLEGLKEVMPYHSYQLLASTRLNSREGEQVQYVLGDDYRFRFRVGKVSQGRRLRLHGLRVSQLDVPETPDKSVQLTDLPERSLLYVNLNLFLGQPLYLGLAASESSSEALILVLTAYGPTAPNPGAAER